jgi:fluoroacetyl-CoA thioesterase
LRSSSDQAARRLSPGLRGRVRATVTDADTATLVGSGDVPVLATPRLLALAEAATLAALHGRLEDAFTSVGTSMALEHKQASRIGAEITVEAELAEVDGRRLVFRFIAWTHDPGRTGSAGESAGPSAGAGTGHDEVAGAGTIERVIVHRERFLARVAGGPPAAGGTAVPG